MKAVICRAYGPPEVLQLGDVPEPRLKSNGVRIRMVATAVTASDCLVRGLRFRGWRRVFLRAAFGVRAPRRIMGMIASGEVEAVGPQVTAFRPGDRVFGMDGFRGGTYAEIVCWPAKSLALAPANLSFEEAAALPYGGLIASHFIRRLNVHEGQRVLIYGASGAIGTSAVQLAGHRGAEVTGVCSTTNVELVRSLGARSVIDYTKSDYVEAGPFDVIFDAVGRRKSAQAMARSDAALAPGGVSMSVDDEFPRTQGTDLVTLKQLAESGEFRPVIDRTFRLDEIVEAHRYVDQGHKKGNVTVTVAAAKAEARSLQSQDIAR
ncbi:MAG TPA: NAD(P)-dependent alcohol dehydrogenase [Candidatus Dormibacteraeota bacterium]|nr:NAD(P)-dependent alcohol dehydrogenase [Candidatus Dormibacteraeota bacterium]